ncbi:hypothetical protein T02_14252 [Trichinella nativa]|uniref:Uncharacterized protein n=1 Tax=Trichinella nativa TaxID=6335 RepID=A0A0V1KLE8_9BILA|nr:hypothetical protein T02_14252 [Trichinella nativa]
MSIFCRFEKYSAKHQILDDSFTEIPKLFHLLNRPQPKPLIPRIELEVVFHAMSQNSLVYPHIDTSEEIETVCKDWQRFNEIFFIIHSSVSQVELRWANG